MKFGRITDDIVVEVVALPDGSEPADYYHPDVAAMFVSVPDAVEAGWISNGRDFVKPPRSEVDLTALKKALKIEIDDAAEVERLKYITPGEGQAMTYQQKVDEARAFKAASNPKAADYPVLSSEVGITAETLSEVADIVLAAFALWQQIGAAIEAVRLGAKRDIDAAADEAAARAIVDAIEWPQPAL
ncbi:hypothetical protein OHI65_14955 [Brucella sp. MAB-22]|uniref:hypothetical protein n=1 Tax=Brucella sp. MAB-22 TaxID=2986424 RepID=UPI002220AF24|nr:hypothetical protein [Brucella sp. MAB-22]UYT57767.1 hypothetical protein OHI65_14955 [Brucella sp. MAB-22]